MRKNNQFVARRLVLQSTLAAILTSLSINTTLAAMTWMRARAAKLPMNDLIYFSRLDYYAASIRLLGRDK